MIATNKGRYGLISMVYMACNIEKKISVKEVAEKEKISKRYLEQVFAALKKNGIVTSVKGSQGGYLLAKSPKDIRVGDILRALEDIDTDSSKANKCSNENIEYTIQKEVWNKIDESINKIINLTTLEDLKNKYNENSSNVYYI